MRILDGHTKSVRAVAFSADGAKLASGGRFGWLRIHDLHSTAPPIDYTFTDLPSCNSLAFHPVIEQLVAACGNHVMIWEPQSEVRQFRLDHEATSLAYADRGQYLIVGCGDQNNAAEPGTTLVYRMDKQKCVFSHGAQHGVWALAADPQGKLALWGGGDRRVTRWELTGQDLKLTQPHTKEIRSIALSADRRTFAATDDYAIRIYDANSMQLQRILTGHQGRIDSLAYLGDGRLLSGSWDNTVRIWDISSGRELAAHNWDVGPVRTVSVSPDGILAAAAGDRGTIVLWDLDH